MRTAQQAQETGSLAPGGDQSIWQHKWHLPRTGRPLTQRIQQHTDMHVGSSSLSSHEPCARAALLSSLRISVLCQRAVALPSKHLLHPKTPPVGMAMSSAYGQWFLPSLGTCWGPTLCRAHGVEHWEGAHPSGGLLKV